MPVKKTAAQQAVTGSTFQYFVGEGLDVSAAVYTQIEGLKSGTLPSPDKPEIDVTDTDSLVREFIPGLGTIPDMSMEFNAYPGNEMHQRIISELVYSEDVRPWKIEGRGMVFMFLGYLKSATISFATDSALSMPLVMKVVSKPVVIFTAGQAGGIAWDNALVGTAATGAVTGTVTATFAAASGVTATFNTSLTDGDPFVPVVDYTIVNVPDGLVAALKKTSPTVATLTLTGTATDMKDIVNLGIAFKDNAFTGATSLKVNNAVKNDLALTFA